MWGLQVVTGFLLALHCFSYKFSAPCLLSVKVYRTTVLFTWLSVGVLIIVKFPDIYMPIAMNDTCQCQDCRLQEMNTSVDVEFPGKAIMCLS
jgi:hypothetical protein